MRKRIGMTLLAFSLLAGTAPWADACSVAGPNKHVGRVIAVDRQAGSFTIMDAETKSPISFSASPSLLHEAATATGAVMVSYVKDGNRLIAKDIHY